MADRVIYTGEPGTVFTNGTAWVQWQFLASLWHTCGTCLGYHTRVSPQPWPIPIHPGCRCRSVPIVPGGDAPEPFIDRAQLFRALPRDRQAVAVGGLVVLRLLDHGLAAWEDVVTPERVRDVWEVVRRRKLTVEQLVKAGIPRFRAEAAVARARSAEAEAAAEEAHRRERLQRLVGPDRAAAALARALATVVGRMVMPAPAAGLGSSPARELARLLSEWRPPRRSVAAGRFRVPSRGRRGGPP
jgi:hypothetical protein